MGVEQKCKEYGYHLDNWVRVRDVIAGEKRIHEKGIAYLPRPSGMEDADWTCYITRAHFFNATGRTAEGLHGMVFQTPPVLSEDVPKALKDILDNIDMTGRNVDQFASDCVWDSLPTNFGGILADYPNAPDVTDKATADKLGLRPYAAWYSAESIINWRKETIENHQVLTFVVLHEPYEWKVANDEFATETKNRYRVLDFDENGNYRVRVYNDAITGGLSAPETTISPKIKNRAHGLHTVLHVPGQESRKEHVARPREREHRTLPEDGRLRERVAPYRQPDAVCNRNVCSSHRSCNRETIADKARRNQIHIRS